MPLPRDLGSTPTRVLGLTCLVGYVCHVGGIQVLGFVVVLQGRVKVLLLVGFIPQLFFSQRLEEVRKEEG